MSLHLHLLCYIYPTTLPSLIRRMLILHLAICILYGVVIFATTLLILRAITVVLLSTNVNHSNVHPYGYVAAPPPPVLYLSDYPSIPNPTDVDIAALDSLDSRGICQRWSDVTPRSRMVGPCCPKRLASRFRNFSLRNFGNYYSTFNVVFQNATFCRVPTCFFWFSD